MIYDSFFKAAALSFSFLFSATTTKSGLFCAVGRIADHFNAWGLL